MTFKTQLRELLIERGLKQADLCHMTNIPSSQISNYITGKTSPSLDNAKIIAEKLNVTLDELVGRKVETKTTAEPTQTIECTADEAELIRMFRALDGGGKRRTLRQLRGEYEDAIADFGEESRNVT